MTIQSAEYIRPRSEYPSPPRTFLRVSSQPISDVDSFRFAAMSTFLCKRNAFAVFTLVALLGSFAFVLRAARSRASNAASVSRVSPIPKTVLWAWERPTDLSFIDPLEVGVAVLVRTIHLGGDDVTVRPRLQSLSVPEAVKVIAVTRVEADPSNKPTLSHSQTERLAAAISEIATLPNVSAVQVDYDATKSEREFYRNLILELRQRLPDRVGLSITALASWCTDDDWISDLPIDEAVPMLFRMGPDGQQITRRIVSGDEFSAKPCRTSYGISTDEPLKDLSTDRRLYVFNPQSWTEESVRKILESRK